MRNVRAAFRNSEFSGGRSLRASSPFGGVARSHASATRVRRACSQVNVGGKSSEQSSHEHEAS